MKIAKNFVVVFLLTFCAFSCSEQSFSAKDILPESKSDSMVRDILMNIDGENTVVYERLRHAVRHYGLDSLENGFKEFQIRIWFMPAFPDSVRLVSIEGIDNKWKADLVHLKVRIEADTLNVKK